MKPTTTEAEDLAMLEAALVRLPGAPRMPCAGNIPRPLHNSGTFRPFVDAATIAPRSVRRAA